MSILIHFLHGFICGHVAAKVAFSIPNISDVAKIAIAILGSVALVFASKALVDLL